MIKRYLKNFSGFLDKYYFLKRKVIQLNSVQELKKVFGWTENPVLDRPDIREFDSVDDVNERRLRDAESLGTVLINLKPRVALEIGTANGMGTVLIAANAPGSEIYTINIPPEEVLSGKGGKLTTVALEREKIGIEYKKRNLTNVHQILANTATWSPEIGKIDFAFVDGCHDKEFVFNDTRKVLDNSHKNSFILWHDFSLGLVKNYKWIDEVCSGVEKLYRKGYLTGYIFHVRDSWVGVYRVE
ncbi:MAG TPA: class I SAM-dependent methyltransferase [Candidatus Acidoferrales bacterium]|nr:class I SAM-dependent methyltransferase [Candidatus Acidoferrales bacterium]